MERSREASGAAETTRRPTAGSATEAADSPSAAAKIERYLREKVPGRFIDAGSPPAAARIKRGPSW